MERRMLLPGVWLTAVQTDKFKTACMSVNLLRPLRREEASLNALLPSVLLRGTRNCPDMQKISAYLDSLYGASLDSLVRKRGEVQTVSFFADCLEDDLAGEPILAQLVAFLGQVLLDPLLEDGLLCPDYVEGEKLNLINMIQAKINDKRAYASARLISQMFASEAYGVDRLGTTQDVAAITAEALTAHWHKILAESRVEIFYMGSAAPSVAAELFCTALQDLPRAQFTPIGTQVIRQAGPLQEITEDMEVTQGKLVMGLRTGICGADEEYPALIVLNTVFGGGVSSKLFLNVREKLSLCYYVGSSIDKSKGVMLISSGIETDQYAAAKAEILRQLEACRTGDISDSEMQIAQRYLLTSYSAAMDSPGSLENFYIGQAIDGFTYHLQDLAARVEAVTKDQVVAAANRLQLDTIYFLKGVEA